MALRKKVKIGSNWAVTKDGKSVEVVVIGEREDGKFLLQRVGPSGPFGRAFAKGPAALRPSASPGSGTSPEPAGPKPKRRPARASGSGSLSAPRGAPRPSRGAPSAAPTTKLKAAAMKALERCDGTVDGIRSAIADVLADEIYRMRYAPFV